MTTPFIQEFAALIDARYKSRHAFVRKAQPGDDEATAQSYLSRVLSGKRPVPLDRAEAWADALALEGREREIFLDKCALTNLPPKVQLRFFGLYERFQRSDPALERRITALERKAKRSS